MITRYTSEENMDHSEYTEALTTDIKLRLEM